jgi:hypothetical protein
MKKLISAVSLLLITIVGYSQTPEIGHFQQLSTIRRGDTLDVAWYFKPAAGTDIRTFQIDWQYKKALLTHISSSVDATVSGNTPVLDFKSWENYKYGSYSNGVYNYVSDTNYSVGRNYLILSNGSQINSNGYIIRNKFKVNDVPSNFEEDSVRVNWARMFKVDGTSIGDNVALLSNQVLDLKLLGNLTISGKIWFPSTITSQTLPTLYCYDNVTNALVSQTVPNLNGNYTFNNVDENKTYKIEVRFPTAMLNTIRDNAVTISDAVKSYNEYITTDVNQNMTRTYLKHGLAYLIGDINLNQSFDGGDPYSIYASVSGLSPINTNKLINVFKKETYDSLVLSQNQWTEWKNHSNKGIFLTTNVVTSNVTLDIKYFVLGDVDRSHSSPVFDGTTEVLAANYKGNFDVNINNSYAVGSPMYVPFNVSTNGGLSNGLQFEMKYDVGKVKFDEIKSNIQGPWLQYVTHDDVNGIIRFGGMNNQLKGSLQGVATPFILKFLAKNPSEDITSDVSIRSLMDASHQDGDHFNINLSTGMIVLSYRANNTNTITLPEPSALLYPNPTNGALNLVVDLLPNTRMNASIYNNSGNQVMNIGDFVSNEFNTKQYKTVDTESLINGVYYFVLTGNNKKITKPFIKN